VSDEFVQAGFDDLMVLHLCNGIGKVLLQSQQGMNSDHQPDDKQGHANYKEGIPIIDPAYSGCTD
jgi:hypothetical protein